MAEDRRRALSCSRAPPLGISCVELFPREAVKLESFELVRAAAARRLEGERLPPPEGVGPEVSPQRKEFAEDSELAPFSLISGACCRAMMNAERFNVTRICKRRRVSLNWGRGGGGRNEEGYGSCAPVSRERRISRSSTVAIFLQTLRGFATGRMINWWASEFCGNLGRR